MSALHEALFGASLGLNIILLTICCLLYSSCKFWKKSRADWRKFYNESVNLYDQLYLSFMDIVNYYPEVKKDYIKVQSKYQNKNKYYH